MSKELQSFGKLTLVKVFILWALKLYYTMIEIPKKLKLYFNSVFELNLFHIWTKTNLTVFKILHCKYTSHTKLKIDCLCTAALVFIFFIGEKKNSGRFSWLKWKNREFIRIYLDNPYWGWKELFWHWVLHFLFLPFFYFNTWGHIQTWEQKNWSGVQCRDL